MIHCHLFLQPQGSLQDSPTDILTWFHTGKKSPLHWYCQENERVGFFFLLRKASAQRATARYYELFVSRPHMVASWVVYPAGSCNCSISSVICFPSENPHTSIQWSVKFFSYVSTLWHICLRKPSYAFVASSCECGLFIMIQCSSMFRSNQLISSYGGRRLDEHYRQCGSDGFQPVATPALSLLTHFIEMLLPLIRMSSGWLTGTSLIPLMRMLG
jgi:hypothetical protein